MQIGTCSTLLILGSILLPGCETSNRGDRQSVSAAQSPPNPAMASSGEPATWLETASLHTGVGPADSDAAREFSTTASGLRYRILRASNGRKPAATSSVEVHYRGWLDSGREFDSSYGRGETTSFPLNGVIPAWTEGLQLIGEGGMIELWVPSDLGYGPRGMPGTIPPNATLHFIVELVTVR